jgi:hypothetical protein
MIYGTTSIPMGRAYGRLASFVKVLFPMYIHTYLRGLCCVHPLFFNKVCILCKGEILWHGNALIGHATNLQPPIH